MSDEATPPASAGDILGSPLSLTYKGERYAVSRPVFRVLDRIEELVAVRAVAACERQAKTLPAAFAARREKELFAKLDACENATGGKMWQAEFEADGGARGLHLILFACLEDAREQAKDKTALPPPIPFADMPDVLEQSPEAAYVSKVLIRCFFSKVAERRKMPAGLVQQVMDKAEAKAGEASATGTS